MIASGLGGYRGLDQGVFQTGQGGAYDAWRNWNKERGPLAFVAAAILAANPHNSQPWVFRVSSNSVDLFADPARNIGSVDPFRREMHVGLGCALENLMLAAEAHGYKASLKLLPTAGRQDHVATVALSQAAGGSSLLFTQIPQRHTDRGAYKSQAVPTADLEQMTVLAADLPDTRLYWFTSPAEVTHIGELMVAAAQALASDEQQSLDDNVWFRQSWDAIQSHKDGLTLDAQGLSQLFAALAKMLPATSRQYNDSFWINHTRDPQVRTAAAYGIIAVPDPDSNEHRLNGGRLLQRVHLWATAHGLSVGHMNQITERADRERQLGLASQFGDASQKLLPDPAFRPLAAFRMGYPASTAAKSLSPRRPVSEVLS